MVGVRQGGSQQPPSRLVLLPSAGQCKIDGALHGTDGYRRAPRDLLDEFGDRRIESITGHHLVDQPGAQRPSSVHPTGREQQSLGGGRADEVDQASGIGLWVDQVMFPTVCRPTGPAGRLLLRKKLITAGESVGP